VSYQWDNSDGLIQQLRNDGSDLSVRAAYVLDLLLKERDFHQRQSVRMGELLARRSLEAQALIDSWSLSKSQSSAEGKA